MLNVNGRTPFIATLMGLGGLLAGAALSACTPPGLGGGCLTNEDCPARGQACDMIQNICVNVEPDFDNFGGDNPPATFTDLALPFFRGRVHYPEGGNSKSGEAMPIVVEPCIHPCMTASGFSVNNQWFCSGGRCEALTLVTTTVSGDNCPVEAFGEFDTSMCTFAAPQSEPPKFGPIIIDDVAADANIELEFPFLTLDDMTVINNADSQASSACQADCGGDSGCLKRCTIEELAEGYPQQSSRVLDLQVRSDHPSPPESCLGGGPGCAVFEIGL